MALSWLSRQIPGIRRLLFSRRHSPVTRGHTLASSQLASRVRGPASSSSVWDGPGLDSATRLAGGAGRAGGGEVYPSKGARQKGEKRTDTFCAPCVGAWWSKGRIYSLPKASQHHRRWPAPKLTDANAQRTKQETYTPNPQA